MIETEFRGITHDGLLRQASYKGLREDKPAREVVRETPETAAAGRGGAAAGGTQIGVHRGPRAPAKTAPKSPMCI